MGVNGRLEQETTPFLLHETPEIYETDVGVTGHEPASVSHLRQGGSFTTAKEEIDTPPLFPVAQPLVTWK